MIFGNVHPNVQPNVRGDAAVLGSFSAEAITLFAAMSSQPTTSRKALYNALIKGLKADGVWTLLDGLYLFAAADSQAAALNIKSPGTFNVTQVNSPAFTADRGFTGASTKYLSTGFAAASASGVNYARNSASIFGWSLLSVANAGALVGLSDSSKGAEILPRWSDDDFYGAINSTAEKVVATSQTDGSGFRCLSRTASASFVGYNAASSVATATDTSVALSSGTLQFLSQNGGLFYSGAVAAGGFGGGLTAGQEAALYARIHTYLQGVGAAT